jgi:hypothetical protein
LPDPGKVEAGGHTLRTRPEPAADRMPEPKQPPDPRQTPAEDRVLRALRAAADEMLEEQVPDRLLDVIRAARSKPPADDRSPEPPAGPAPPPGKR